MNRRAPKVFISYAREDAGIANKLYDDLKETGAEPWLDEKCLLPGQRWSDEIGKAIRQSDFFLALLSNKSLGKRGYVQKEFRDALAVLDEIPEGDIYLLPARLDDCRPNNQKMRELNWVDLFPSYQAGFEKILRVVLPPNVAVTSVLAPSGIQDESDLARQGWGIIFADHTEGSAVRNALQPLLDLRREQASLHNERFYREFSGETAYRVGSSYLDFLVQNGVGPGIPDPGRVPTYLLIAAGPESIPFEFQYGLGIQYRTGRLHFDKVEDYRNYAESIVSVETGVVRASRRAAFFGPRHENDLATALASEQLTVPLIESMALAFPGFKLENIEGAKATKSTLQSLLGRDRLDLLFSISHGMAFPMESESQTTGQGALLCADWLGSGTRVEREHYFSASDLDYGPDQRGLQLLLVAEYGAGTPGIDNFVLPERAIASRPFVSPLAKRLLGRPRGAAALLGHVDMTWSYSFNWPRAGPQIQTFVNAVGTMLSGRPVGLAQKYFSARYAELAAKMGTTSSQDSDYQNLRIAMLDARNYIVIGDPAARIPLTV